MTLSITQTTQLANLILLVRRLRLKGALHAHKQY